MRAEVCGCSANSKANASVPVVSGCGAVDTRLTEKANMSRYDSDQILQLPNIVEKTRAAGGSGPGGCIYLENMYLLLDAAR